MEEAAGIILVGGGGTRLGGTDKGRLRVGGLPLIERVVQALRAAGISEIVLAGRPGAYADTGLPAVADIEPGKGPLAGLVAGLAAVSKDHAFACAVDMPYLDPILVRGLFDRAASWDVVLPVVGAHPEPLHAVYARRAAGALRARLAAGVTRLQDAVSGLSCLRLDGEALRAITPQYAASFRDIDTPEDLAGA